MCAVFLLLSLFCGIYMGLEYGLLYIFKLKKWLVGIFVKKKQSLKNKKSADFGLIALLLALFFNYLSLV